jgi:hypothetical protein
MTAWHRQQSTTPIPLDYPCPKGVGVRSAAERTVLSAVRRSKSDAEISVLPLLTVAGLTGISRREVAVVDVSAVIDGLDAEKVVTAVPRGDGTITLSTARCLYFPSVPRLHVR